MAKWIEVQIDMVATQWWFFWNNLLILVLVLSALLNSFCFIIYKLKWIKFLIKCKWNETEYSYNSLNSTVNESPPVRSLNFSDKRRHFCYILKNFTQNESLQNLRTSLKSVILVIYYFIGINNKDFNFLMNYFFYQYKINMFELLTFKYNVLKYVF